MEPQEEEAESPPPSTTTNAPTTPSLQPNTHFTDSSGMMFAFCDYYFGKDVEVLPCIRARTLYHNFNRRLTNQFQSARNELEKVSWFPWLDLTPRQCAIIHSLATNKDPNVLVRDAVMMYHSLYSNINRKELATLISTSMIVAYEAALNDVESMGITHNPCKLCSAFSHKWLLAYCQGTTEWEEGTRCTNFF